MVNDGFIAVDHVLNANQGAVLCHTNDESCCANGQTITDDWYFPDGTLVNSFSQNFGHRSFFARNRGTDPPVVRLYCVGEPQERGRFRCDIRDTAGVLQQLYVNICKFGL